MDGYFVIRQDEGYSIVRTRENAKPASIEEASEHWEEEWQTGLNVDEVVDKLTKLEIVK